MASTGEMPQRESFREFRCKVSVMRIGEWIITVLVLVAVASYGFVAALSLLP